MPYANKLDHLSSGLYYKTIMIVSDDRK